MLENFSYENQGTNTYLKFIFPKNATPDRLALGMISNNSIDGFLTSIYGCADGVSFIKYNISAKISVKQFFTGTVNKKKVISVLKGILTAFISAEDYMINTNYIILDLDYIFVNVSTCQTEVICVPFSDASSGNNNLKEIFRNIIFTLNYDQTENCDYIAKLINYLNSSGSFSVKGFKEVLDSIDGGKSEAMKAEAVQTPVAVQNITAQNVQKPNVQATPVMPKPAETTYQAPAASPTNTNVGFQSPVQKPKTANNIAAPSPSVNVPPKSPNMAAPQSSFAVPGKVPPKAPMKEVSQQTTAESSEKPMSMFYLLQHYNKENAAKYKAQKEAKKSGKQQNPQSPQAQPQIQYTQVQQPTPAYNPMPTPPMAPAKVPATQAASSSVGNAPMQKPMNDFAPVQQPTNMAQPNFGDTTVLSGGNVMGDTTVLGNDMGTTYQQAKSAYLVRKKNNERVKITKDVFYIGKERSFVDYFIGDNPAISRSHANIICKNGEYFIVDTNSTNHTFLDGQMLTSNVEAKLESGCEITLANEKFIFEIV